MSTPPPHNGWRTFLTVWVTQSFSSLGSALTFFALTIWLTEVKYPDPAQKRELAFALSAMGLCFSLPHLFLGPLAGAWADRHDRKRTMLVTDLGSGVLSLILIWLISAGTPALWSLLLLLGAFSALGVFHHAAFDTAYAMLVPPERLPRANGMMQTTWSMAGILAPSLAAILIALPAMARQGKLGRFGDGLLGGVEQGAALAIAFDALSFFGAGLVLLFQQIPSPRRDDLVGGPGRRRKSIWADVQEGALYIWRRRPLLWLLGAFAAVNLLASPIHVFQTLVVKFNLSADLAARGLRFEQGLAIINAAAGFGGVAGGVLISAWGGLKLRRIYGVLIPMVFAGLVQIGFGLSAGLTWSVATLFLMRAMVPIMNAHSQAIWQTQTPYELQGRVFSVRRLIAQCTVPMGTVMAGWAGGLFDPGVAVFGLGIMLTVLSASLLFHPQMQRVEDKEGLDRMAAPPAAG